MIDRNSLYQLIIGLLIGAAISYLATLIPASTMQKVVQFIGGAVVALAVIDFVLVLLKFPPLVSF